MRDDILKDVAEELKLFEEDEEEQEEEDFEEDEEEQEEEDFEEDEEEQEEEDFEEDEEEEEIVLETKRQKRSPEEKAAYAFESLRKENKENKDKIQKLDEIAQSYGFRTHDEMLYKLEQDALERQAKEKDVDPEIYKRMHEQEKQLQALKEERENEQKAQKAATVLSRVNEFIEENNLKDSDREFLITELDEDGFTVDMLASVKNYKALFKGYVADKISEAERQKKLSREAKKKKLEEDKFKDTGNQAEASMEDIINNLIAKRKNTYY